MPEELWIKVCDIVQEEVIKIILKEKKCKKMKWLSEEDSQIAEKRREAKGKGEPPATTTNTTRKETSWHVHLHCRGDS